MQDYNIMRNFFAHEQLIDQNCIIGEQQKFGISLILWSHQELGKKCNIGQNVVISPGVVLEIM